MWLVQGHSEFLTELGLLGRSSDLQSWVFYSITLRSQPILRFHDSVTLWFYNSKTKHNNASAPGSLGTEEEHGLDLSTIKNIFSFQNINCTIMDSNSAHNPVFLVFPPEINVPDLRSTELIATAYDTSGPFPKSLATKMKILGVSHIFPNVYSTEGVLWTICVPYNS